MVSFGISPVFRESNLREHSETVTIELPCKALVF